MPFEFEKQKIEDVILVKPKVFGDNRGFFMESYKKSDFYDNGIAVEFNQDNQFKISKRRFKRTALSGSTLWTGKTCKMRQRPYL